MLSREYLNLVIVQKSNNLAYYLVFNLNSIILLTINFTFMKDTMLG